jgi:hypothetical protein
MKNLTLTIQFCEIFQTFVSAIKYENTYRYTLERQRVRIVLRGGKSHFDHELCIPTIFSNVAYENESQF